jgi:AcrR family transcriptional regulator
MGRRKVIDREAILDAAERVVSRDGAVRLTLEAVAAEAKISKASVLYDYKSKQMLIRAVIERRVAAENARIQEYIDRLGPVADGPIRGRIAATSRPIPDEDRPVAISLCAALAQDAQLRQPIQNIYRERIAEILATSKHPRGAMLAFLAVEGLMLMEWFGLHSWPEPERSRLVAEIAWLIDHEPSITPGDGTADQACVDLSAID